MSQAPTDEGGKPAEATQAPFVLIVSGLSGSGKSVALKTLEDLDYYCVDNLPIELLPDFIRSLMREDVLPQKVAVGIDVRNRHSDLSRLSLWRAAVGRLGLDAKLVFFDSEDAVLLRRYSDTRRRHPLSHTGLSLPEAVARERQVTQPLRLEADLVIDTSQLNVHQLRRRVVGEFAFDSRDAPVRKYLEAQEDVQRYVRQVSEFLDTWLPRLRGETRSYVTVAFGCTGGKHRSVFLTERLAEHARSQGWDQVATFHRELD